MLEGQLWWFMLVHATAGGLRQDSMSKTALGYTVRICEKAKPNKRKRQVKEGRAKRKRGEEEFKEKEEEELCPAFS